MSDFVRITLLCERGRLEVRARLDGWVACAVELDAACLSNVSLEDRTHGHLMATIDKELRQALREAMGQSLGLAFGGSWMPRGPVRGDDESDDGAGNGKPRRGGA